MYNSAPFIQYKKLEYKACHIGNDFFVFIMYVVGRNLRKNKQSSMKVGSVVTILAVRKYPHGVALLQPLTRSFRQPQNGGDPGLKKITCVILGMIFCIYCIRCW